MKSLLAFNLKDIRMGPDYANIDTISKNYSSTNIFISMILKNSITLASIILLALLIFGGITFIMSAGSGDSKKAEQGKKAITNALIGFAIVLLAYSIIKIVQTITGVNILYSNI